MSMARADLADDLVRSLGSSAEHFDREQGGAGFDRLLDAAALDMGRVQPRVMTDALSLVAGQAAYPAPAEMVRPQHPVWPPLPAQPWARRYRGPMPLLRRVVRIAEVQVAVSPVPTEALVADVAGSLGYYYEARHSIGELAEETTIDPGWRDLLLLRAQAEACRELALSNVVKPIQLHRGMGAQPTRAQPSVLYELLMSEFKARGMDR